MIQEGKIDGARVPKEKKEENEKKPKRRNSHQNLTINLKRNKYTYKNKKS